jgi:hypothetical protein
MFVATPNSHQRLRTRSKQASFQPRLEAFESRMLLSTCHVTRLGDFGSGFLQRGDLRYCVNKTNADPGPDSIDFFATGTITINSTLPEVIGDLTILGPGRSLLRIDAHQQSRVFNIDEGVVVVMSGVTITGGRDFEGAGIYNKGNLSLQDCSVSGNAAVNFTGPAFGAGIYNFGTLDIDNCLLNNNRITSSNNYGLGGGIYNLGNLTVTNSTFDNNKISARRPYGGAIANYLAATVSHTIISNNSTVTSFDAPSYGGGLYNGGATLLLENSLVYQNVSTSVGEAYGAGVYGKQGSLEIINSTISKNIVDGEEGEGGGVWIESDLTISHSTIVHNEARGIGGEGGGIYVEAGIGATNVYGTIIALNIADVVGPDVHGDLTDSMYNLIGDSSGTGTIWDATDILDVDPMLGPLQNNGGLTETYALLTGSPAIDEGGFVNTPPPWDQRGVGYHRVVNGTVDIGAYEVQSTGAPMPDFSQSALGTSLTRWDRLGLSNIHADWDELLPPR